MTTGTPATIAPPHVLPAPLVPDPARIALFLDVDGTLLEFADHPDGVAVDPSLRMLLASLWRALCGALAPVSGRPLDQVDRQEHRSGRPRRRETRRARSVPPDA